jgi:hypothetical protein
MCEHARYIDLPIDGLGPHPSAPVTALTPMPSETAGPAAEPRAPKARRKLWEIPHKYHCPVIGTCMHVNELRRLAQKAGYRPKHQLSDYDIHVSFVAAANDKNALSLAVQRLLERKHTAAVRRFARADTPEALEQMWDEALANGQVQGALWAIMTHPQAPIELRALAYEDVHMLSHQIGAGLNADLKALSETREQLAQVRRESSTEAERMARRLAERDARIAALETRLEAAIGSEQALAAAQARIATLEQDRPHKRLQALEQQLQAVERREQAVHTEAEGLRQRAEAAEARSDTLAAQLLACEQDLHALQRLLPAVDENDACGCDGDCAQCRRPQSVIDGLDLSGRRILCVGGRGSLLAHYRDLVQRCNGELIRHDGGLEDSRQRLEALLARADAVVCPADCVSHDAYLRTKRYCKRLAKPCVLIDRSGIGAFAAALSQLADAAAAAAEPAPVVTALQPA